MAGGKRESRVTAEGQRTLQSQHLAMDATGRSQAPFKDPPLQRKDLEVGKVEGETLPRGFLQEARHGVGHTNVDTKKETGRSETHLQAK